MKMKNKAEIFHKKVLKELIYYTPYKVERFFADLRTGDGRSREYWNEIYRNRLCPCWFYQYIACAARMFKWKQTVEIGADRGASALMVASEMPNGKVYSIDHRGGVSQGNQAWMYIPDDVTNIVKVEMDSLEIDKLLATGVDLLQTDFWIIDGEHTPDRVRRECVLYGSYWKEGAVIYFDDLSSIQPAFDELPFEHKFIDFGNLHGGTMEGSGLVVV